jgi:hypothetical protein
MYGPFHLCSYSGLYLSHNCNDFFEDIASKADQMRGNVLDATYLKGQDLVACVPLIYHSLQHRMGQVPSTRFGACGSYL